MYERFNKMSFAGRVIVVIVALFLAMIVFNIVLGLIKTLIPFAIIAVLVVGALALFERVRD